MQYTLCELFVGVRTPKDDYPVLSMENWEFELRRAVKNATSYQPSRIQERNGAKVVPLNIYFMIEKDKVTHASEKAAATTVSTQRRDRPIYLTNTSGVQTPIAPPAMFGSPDVVAAVTGETAAGTNILRLCSEASKVAASMISVISNLQKEVQRFLGSSVSWGHRNEESNTYKAIQQLQEQIKQLQQNTTIPAFNSYMYADDAQSRKHDLDNDLCDNLDEVYDVDDEAAGSDNNN